MHYLLFLFEEGWDKGDAVIFLLGTGLVSLGFLGFAL